MARDTTINDVLIAPLERMLSEVGRGIANAQRDMDLNSITLQARLDNDPELRDRGLEASFYHFPEVDVELKIALSLRREDRTRDGKLTARKFRMYAAPINASYQRNFQTEIEGTSQIRAKIVSVPPVRKGP